MKSVDLSIIEAPGAPETASSMAMSEAKSLP